MKSTPPSSTPSLTPRATDNFQTFLQRHQVPTKSLMQESEALTLQDYSDYDNLESKVMQPIRKQFAEAWENVVHLHLDRIKQE